MFNATEEFLYLIFWYLYPWTKLNLSNNDLGLIYKEKLIITKSFSNLSQLDLSYNQFNFIKFNPFYNQLLKSPNLLNINLENNDLNLITNNIENFNQVNTNLMKITTKKPNFNSFLGFFTCLNY